jgi:hypothetical protein
LSLLVGSRVGMLPAFGMTLRSQRSPLGFITFPGWGRWFKKGHG